MEEVLEQQIKEEFYQLIAKVLVQVLYQAEEQLVEELHDWDPSVLAGLTLLFVEPEMLVAKETFVVMMKVVLILLDVHHIE